MDKFKPEDLFKKGFEPDGKGGYQKRTDWRIAQQRPSVVIPLQDILYPVNKGESFWLPDGKLINIKYRFDINPCPAPRMVRSDKWKTNPEHADQQKRQRPSVARYFKWRDTFLSLCLENGFKLDEKLSVVFIFPMPKYWNRKKKADNVNQPHRQRPDADNCAKSIMDAFGLDDGYVWDLRAVKIWGEKGQILIF